MTKSYKNKYRFCRITSILLEILPVLIFTIMAFVNGEVHEKVTFGIILMAINRGINRKIKLKLTPIFDRVGIFARVNKIPAPIIFKNILPARFI